VRWQGSGSTGPLRPLKPLLKQPLAVSAAAGAGASEAPHVTAPPTDADLQQLLTLVRERYPTAGADSAANTSSDATGASSASTAASSATVTAASAPVAASSAASAAAVAAAADSSASFSDAADSVKTDKLAILMSLFKSRGIAPPPLPLFDGPPPPPPPPSALSFGVEESNEHTAPAAATNSDTRAVASARNAVAAAAASPPPAAASSSAASNAAATPSASSTAAAEIAQLTVLFDHARNKICKLCRLYQSGVLTGGASAQALDKLSALMRTYYAFIQHAKSHKHIVDMSGDIAADIRCTSLQHLSDRLYAQAKA